MLVFFMHTSPFSLLPGPLLFFYVRNTLNDSNRMKWTDLLHFIPFILVSIDFMPYFLLPLDEKRKIIELVSQDLGQTRNYLRGNILQHFHYIVIRWLLWIGYLTGIIIMLYRRRPEKIHNPVIPMPQYRITYNWFLTLSLLLTATLIPNFLMIVTFHSGRVDLNGPGYASMPPYIITLSIYFLAFLSIMIYPQILYGMPQYKGSLQTNIRPSDGSFISGRPAAEPEKVSETSISRQSGDPFIELSNAIESYIVEEKPYLDPEFSISTISHRFKVPQHHVHYCFSRIIQCGFPAYRNRLRVEFAKGLLAGEHGRTLTIDAIGKESGFSGKMNFYNAFKKETGLTPKQYADKLEPVQTQELTSLDESAPTSISEIQNPSGDLNSSPK